MTSSNTTFKHRSTNLPTNQVDSGSDAGWFVSPTGTFFLYGFQGRKVHLPSSSRIYCAMIVVSPHSENVKRTRIWPIVLPFAGDEKSDQSPFETEAYRHPSSPSAKLVYPAASNFSAVCRIVYLIVVHSNEVSVLPSRSLCVLLSVKPPSLI